MPTFTVPNSWGTRLREANDCHTPAGSPQGGEFCDADGIPSRGDRAAKQSARRASVTKALADQGVSGKHLPVLAAIFDESWSQLKRQGMAMMDLDEVYDGVKRIPGASVRAAVTAHPRIGKWELKYSGSSYSRSSDRWRSQRDGGVPASRTKASLTIRKAREA